MWSVQFKKNHSSTGDGLDTKGHFTGRCKSCTASCESPSNIWSRVGAPWITMRWIVKYENLTGRSFWRSFALTWDICRGLWRDTSESVREGGGSYAENFIYIYPWAFTRRSCGCCTRSASVTRGKDEDRQGAGDGGTERGATSIRLKHVFQLIL